MERRNLLKVLVAGSAAAVARPALARAKKEPPQDAVGMLYDSTRCIGCKACVVACREQNKLPPSVHPAAVPAMNVAGLAFASTSAPTNAGLYDYQTELDATTKNVIKLYRDEKDPSVFAFMKQQCMHCVDPSCVSVCMLGALQKSAQGAVTYDKDKCIGCRYCQVACPFNVPKFEWQSATPKIVKCELCPERRAEGKQPACTEACPRQAVIYGRLEDLKKEAHRRIAERPGFYQPKVYGEQDMGGTQVLYLSAVPFTKLGLPEKGDRSGASVSETIQHGVYQGFIAPAVLYAGLLVAVLRNRKKQAPEGEEKK